MATGTGRPVTRKEPEQFRGLRLGPQGAVAGGGLFTVPVGGGGGLGQGSRPCQSRQCLSGTQGEVSPLCYC